MRIVIKVGTQAIVGTDGALLSRTLSTLVRQIVALQKEGHQVALVSSGAVGSGRKTAKAVLNREFGSTTGEKQVLASLGQHELMTAYARLFRPHGLAVAQLLLTKQDFQTRRHYLNVARLLREIFNRGNIVPVINENDSVSIEELMFTDNDELAGLIAAQMNADKLVILTSIEGVYDGPPDAKESALIPVIAPETGDIPVLSTVRTAQGRGGMVSKLDTARKASALGITTHIASIRKKDVVLRLAGGEQIGTTVLPARRKSNIKKWIAYSDGRQSGAVRVNAPLLDILKKKDRVISLLPVGITACTGTFKRGDLIDVTAPDGRKIGIGIARYDSDKLRDCMGQKGKPAFIHYDHLHLKDRI